MSSAPLHPLVSEQCQRIQATCSEHTEPDISHINRIADTLLETVHEIQS